MGLNLQLVALTLPDGTEFWGTPQALVDALAQYLSIGGDESFSGINYGDVEPDPDARDRPWFKTDGGGNPIGWFSWNGLVWAPSPISPQNGGTSDRPISPDTGRLYFDTDIDVLLIYNGAAWVTAAGSPGDVKEVRATTLSDALLKNPGWSHDTDSVGMVIAGASDGSSYVYDSNVGADEVMLEAGDLPDTTVPLKTGWAPYSGSFQNGPQPAGIYPIVTGFAPTSETASMNSGTQTGVDVKQLTKYLWRLSKD